MFKIFCSRLLTSCALGICLQCHCVCRDPALHSNSACTVLKVVCRVNGLLLTIHKHAGLLDVILINKIWGIVLQHAGHVISLTVAVHVILRYLHTTTTTVLRPFFRDHPGEPVPEENFWTLWCKGRLTEADTPTIRLGTVPSGLTSSHLHHPIFLQARCPSCRPTNSVKALKATSAFGLGRRR